MRTRFFIAIGILGLTLLLALGIWQVQRLAEKEDLLNRIENGIGGAPIPLKEALSPEFQRYAPVSVSGRFEEGTIRMLASRRAVGAVYRIIRPFNTKHDGRILVDTGWIAQSEDLADITFAPLSLIGNLDNPIEADRFTPPPNQDERIWFARDVTQMAQELGTQPILVVLRDPVATAELGTTPWPVSTAGIPNNHLQYAITWFLLAIVWAGMTMYFWFRTRRMDV